ncbi:MAG: hypothetical protein ABI681_06505 [Gemmatimonadales bacterium]
MRSTLSMTLAGFGIVFLGFGSVMMTLGLLGLRFGTRHALGGAGALALGALLIGAVLTAGGIMTHRNQGRREE